MGCSANPGVAKVIQQCRERYYYPGLALKKCQHISQCQECLQTRRTPNNTITLPLINMSQIAKTPCKWTWYHSTTHQSGGYNAIITTMDVFSRYLFAYNVVRVDTKTMARVLIDIITRHCYLPTTIITDKDSQFISEAMKQITDVLGI